MRNTRDLATAQHEAAHVVVGVALGLRLLDAVILPVPADDGELAYARFWVPRSRRMAWALTLAAGVAFERATRGVGDEGDREELRRLGYRGRNLDALVTAAAAILESRSTAHSRITRVLAERDLTDADVAVIARGGRVHTS